MPQPWYLSILGVGLIGVGLLKVRYHKGIVITRSDIDLFLDQIV